MWLDSALLGPLRDLVPEPGPARRFGLNSLTNSVGEGLFISGTAVFATRVVGLDAEQVGFCLGAAGVAGVIAAGTMGALADRFGARRMIIILSLAQGVGYIAYCFVRSFPAFLVLACLLSVLSFGKSPANAALVSSVSGPEGRVRLRAQSRSLFNVGFSVGAGLAALALTVATLPAYLMLPIGNAVTYFVSAYLMRTLPEARGHGKRRSFGALRSIPFLSTTLLNTVLALHGSLTLVVVPLWIVERTAAPHALTGILLVLNTVLAMLFQVRVSRGAESLRGSVRKSYWTAAVLAPTCLLVALSSRVGLALAIVVLVAAYVLLTWGEMLQTASSWGISYSLAPPHAQAEYLGAFGMGMAAQTFLGSSLGTWAVFQHDVVGWLGLAIAFLVAAALLGPVSRWAEVKLAESHPEPVRQAAVVPAAPPVTD